MKKGSSAIRIVYIPLTLLIIICCKGGKEKPQPVISLDDYYGLQVGTSWEYKITTYEAVKNPDSPPQFTAVDSIIQTKSCTAHTDSTWYFTIKDSLFFRWRCTEQGKGYCDTPTITMYRDTCIQHSSGLSCRVCTYSNLNLNLMTDQWTDSISVGGTTYPFFWKMLGQPVHFVYYVKNIGLTMYGQEAEGNMHCHGTTVCLSEFNGIKNDLYRFLTNSHIDESYTFQPCSPQ